MGEIKVESQELFIFWIPQIIQITYSISQIIWILEHVQLFIFWCNYSFSGSRASDPTIQFLKLFLIFLLDSYIYTLFVKSFFSSQIITYNPIWIIKVHRIEVIGTSYRGNWYIVPERSEMNLPPSVPNFRDLANRIPVPKRSAIHVTMLLTLYKTSFLGLNFWGN